MLIAGLFEVSWGYRLKFSNGFTQPFVSVFTVICMIASFYFLALAFKKSPARNCLCSLDRIGTLGTVILGILLFKEPVTVMRILCIGLIVTGITGLKLLSV